MSLIKLFFFGLVGTLLFYACGNGSSGIEEQVVPIFKSSFPEDNAVDISLNSDIQVTFDEVITLASSHGITVNNESVDVSVLPSSTYVKILLTLESDKEYTVKVPAGAVINSKGVSSDQNIEFSFSTVVPITINIDADLVTPNPSSGAVNIYNFLKENYGEKIISSTVANVNWNINEAEWVKQHTGKYPAMATFDYIHLMSSPTSWIDYSNTTVVEDWWNNNGIVSACWHWNVPKISGSSEVAFYTDVTNNQNVTNFDIRQAILTGTTENDIILDDLEKRASYLLQLKEKNIPVVWRPLHEAAGGWFWWGAKGAEPYKALWKLMFDFFETKGLNNLIWVWTTETGDADWYPGDDYVDIIGRDAYNEANASSLAAEFTSIQETYPNKMITLSECGNIANISQQWTSGAKWSFFMPWYDYDRTNDINESDFSGTEHEHANAAWWIDAFNSENVLTLDDMPDWDSN